MDESMTAESKKQGTQKPPLSWRRIAGEILAGTATAFAIELLVVCVVLFANKEKFDSYFGGLVAGGIILCGFPVTYGPASAVGVYLVGAPAKQTGSFLLTLGCGFAGELGAIAILPVPVVGVMLLSLIPPILATPGFNATRRYKELPSS